MPIKCYIVLDALALELCVVEHVLAVEESTESGQDQTDFFFNTAASLVGTAAMNNRTFSSSNRSYQFLEPILLPHYTETDINAMQLDELEILHTQLSQSNMQFITRGHLLSQEQVVGLDRRVVERIQLFQGAQSLTMPTQKQLNRMNVEELSQLHTLLLNSNGHLVSSGRLVHANDFIRLLQEVVQRIERFAIAQQLPSYTPEQINRMGVTELVQLQALLEIPNAQFMSQSRLLSSQLVSRLLEQVLQRIHILQSAQLVVIPTQAQINRMTVEELSQLHSLLSSQNGTFITSGQHIHADDVTHTLQFVTQRIQAFAGAHTLDTVPSQARIEHFAVQQRPQTHK